MKFRSGVFYKTFIGLYLATSLCAMANAETTPTIRVLVGSDKTSYKAFAKGAYKITAADQGMLIKSGNGLRGLSIKSAPKGIMIEGKVYPTSFIRVHTSGTRDLFIDKARFRGDILIYKQESSDKLLLVNVLDIESYLYGVLHHEVAAWWPMEALKAQAVAARTYATYQIQMNKRNLYDVKNSTSSQVYGASTTERFRTNLAVDRTRGQILEFNRQIVPAFFYAVCAGTTAGASELWSVDMPPIAGGVVCGYCKIAPHYSWNLKVPLLDIEQKLKLYGRGVGQLLDIQVVSLTPSGRVGRLKFIGSQREILVAAKDFRVWMGGNKMKSTNFKINTQRDFADFQGKGWGHGVGLCQWGALGQSLLGKKYTQILQFYYPGSIIDGGSDS